MAYLLFFLNVSFEEELFLPLIKAICQFSIFMLSTCCDFFKKHLPVPKSWRYMFLCSCFVFIEAVLFYLFILYLLSLRIWFWFMIRMNHFLFPVEIQLNPKSCTEKTVLCQILCFFFFVMYQVTVYVWVCFWLCFILWV